jgi:hypothetical protein
MRAARRLVTGVLMVLIVVGGSLRPTVAGASSPARGKSVVGAAARAQIEGAFRHLVSPFRPVVSQRAFIQGYDPALASALQGAWGSGFGASGGVTTLSEVFGVVRRASATVVTVPVVFTEPGGAAWATDLRHYVGTALRVHGRWKVSWATVCAIIEASDAVCPAAPRGVTSTVPPPSYDPTESSARLLAPGLIDPSALAAGPDGSLLIADTGRDQVLRRTAGGQLQVVAGTGRSGFAGDGGPATDAELDLTGPTSLAVTPDGSLFIADTGNDRVRMVSSIGIITTVAGDGTSGHTGDGGPATDAEVEQPDGLALGADGSLYIADGLYIRKVSTDGTITTVAGGGPPYGVDVAPGGSSVAFSPESLAFDGDGDLDVFSFSPKMIFQLPAGPDGPSGSAIRVLSSANYATALAPAPDGSVVVAEHGAALERIPDGPVQPGDQGTTVQTLFDFLDTSVTGYGIPGIKGAFSPEGVAVLPDGTIDADTDDGNGYSPQIALVQVTPSGHARVLPVVGPVTGSLPAVGGPGFPTATYPAAVSARSGAGLSSCPSSVGLEAFDSRARAAAVSEAEEFDTSFPTALADADRSWWTQAYRQWADPTGLGRHALVRAVPAARDLYAPVVARACGPGVVARSFVVVVGHSAYSTEVSHVYFVDRGGRPLVYYQNA